MTDIDLLTRAERREQSAKEFIDRMVANERRRFEEFAEFAGDPVSTVLLSNAVSAMITDPEKVADMLSVAIRRLAALTAGDPE